MLYNLVKHKKQPSDKHLLHLTLYDVNIEGIGWIQIAVKDYETLKDLVGERLIQAQDTMHNIIL